MAMTPTVFLAMHHKVEPSETLLRRIFTEAAPKTILPSNRPVTPGDREAWLDLMRRYKFQGSLPGFELTRTHEGKKSHVSLSIALYTTGAWDMGPRRMVRIKPFQEAPWNWLIMHSSSSISPHDAGAGAWLLEQVSPFLPIFEPTFAFGTTHDHAAKNIGDDPRKVGWPLMIFGPELVTTMGRDLLLKTPAWKVEELPYGGVLVQVDEAPFYADEAKLREASEHLGLKVPTG